MLIRPSQIPLIIRDIEIILIFVQSGQIFVNDNLHRILAGVIVYNLVMLRNLLLRSIFHFRRNTVKKLLFHDLTG